MRKVVISEFMSLDGVIEGPGGDRGYVHGPWTVPYWCDEIGAFKTEELESADTLLIGRITYESFAGAWPDRAGDPFADKLNGMRKLVASTTLPDAGLWANTTVVRRDLDDAIRAERQTDGGDILLSGSVSVAHALLRADLVDELRLAVYPLTLGTGLRMFPDDLRVDLPLVSCTNTPTGVLLLTYRRGEGPTSTEAFPYDLDDATEA